MFIMSLAIADLTVGIVVIPISATAFIMGPGSFFVAASLACHGSGYDS